MIVAMIRPRRCFLLASRTVPSATAAAFWPAIALAGLFLAAPAFPQSSGAPAPQTPAPAQATPPSAPQPQPDKTRARNAYETGRRAEKAGDWKAELAAYTEAAAYDPSNREYAMLKEHARFQVVQSLVESAERQAIAGNVTGARDLLTQALAVDPNYAVARERLSELTPGAEEPAEETAAAKQPRLAGLPQLNHAPGARPFDFRGTTRGAFEEVGKQFGVKMVFDGDLVDRSVQFQVPAVDFDTAIEILTLQTRTFTRVVDAGTLFVTQDTPQKEREYAPEVEKELLLPASVTSDEMNETVRMIREMTGISRTQVNTAQHTLTVRSTPQNVALAQKLIEQIEQPHGELMLDIDILELDKTTATQLGVTPPTSSTVTALTLPEVQQLEASTNNGTLIQTLQSIFGSSAISSATGSALPALIAFGGGKSIFFATMPGATANFGTALSTAQSAQRVLMRAQDGKPATFFVGDRYPIDLGLLSSQLASPTGSLAASLLSGLTLPRTDYDVGKGPVGVAIADYNGDGHPDLAVANQDGTISILFGNGDGTFQAEASPCSLPTCIQIPGVTSGSTTTAAVPSGIVTADFNGDGFPDLAVADSANNRVLVYLGDGKGNFSTTPGSFPTGNKPVALVAQDFNNDGQPDLAIVNQTDGSVTILLDDTVNGIGTGSFGTPPDQKGGPPAVGKVPSAIGAGDFVAGNANVSNTNADIAVTNSSDNTVSVLLGNGDGTFATQTVYATGNGPAGVAVADYNADGAPDLAVTNETDGTVSILLNQNNGSGTFFGQNAFTTGSNPEGIVAAIFVGSTMDLATADAGSDNMDILIGNGDGTFNAPISLAVGNGPVALADADLIGNGSLDLVSANNVADTVSVTINTVGSSIGSGGLSLPSSQVGYPGATYEDLGLKIKATPRLHDNDEVTLQLEFDIKSLSGSSINSIPILTNRQIEQTVRLREGETSVLSGLIQKNDLNSISGWPWVSTVPGIGLLTGEETPNVQLTELLILVTPRALRLPPHQVPAVYAGRGEPATPPSPAPAPPPPPGAAPQPGQPGAPGQPGGRGGPFQGAQPGQPGQPGQPVGTFAQPGQAPQPGQPGAPGQPRPNQPQDQQQQPQQPQQQQTPPAQQ
jgi:type II secretory pathway component GspD/PulD (secretin)